MGVRQEVRAGQGRAARRLRAAVEQQRRGGRQGSRPGSWQGGAGQGSRPGSRQGSRRGQGAGKGAGLPTCTERYRSSVNSWARGPVGRLSLLYLPVSSPCTPRQYSRSTNHASRPFSSSSSSSSSSSRRAHAARHVQMCVRRAGRVPATRAGHPATRRRSRSCTRTQPVRWELAAHLAQRAVGHQCGARLPAGTQAGRVEGWAGPGRAAGTRVKGAVHGAAQRSRPRPCPCPTPSTRRTTATTHTRTTPAPAPHLHPPRQASRWEGGTGGPRRTCRPP